ncbi:MAG TPA: radical SAM protein [Ignavibacteria bacterium]
MKVLLVGSPKNYFGIDMYIKIPNLGLCSIAGNIDKGLAEVHILDLVISGKNHDKYFTDTLKKLNPEIIGFSSMIFQYKHLLSLAKIAKSINPDVKVIFGGYYPTIDFDTIAQNGDMKYIDFLISGEGELSFNEFLKAYNNSCDYSKVPGLTYKINGSVFHNPPGCLVDLDEMKFPDRSVRLLTKGFHLMGLKADVIETSRGCVYDCNFCSIGMMYGKSFRKFKIERVLEDIKNVRRLGAKAVMMTDDNITLDGKRFKELCIAMKQSGLNKITYLVQASIKGIRNTPGLVKAMAEAGIKLVFLGIENVSESALDSMKKGNQFDTNDTIEVLKELKAYRIMVIGGFILGNPDDDENSLLSNFEFAKKLKVDFPLFNVITPYPKTPIREDLLNMGLITNLTDYTRYDCWEVNVKTKHLSTEQIYKIRDDMSLRYPFESGAIYNFFKEFPVYTTILGLKWLYHKPTDVFKSVLKGSIKKNSKRN